MSLTKINLSAASKYFMVFFISMMLMLPFSLMAQEEQQEQEEQEEKEEEEDPWADVEFPFEDEKLLTFFDANQEISQLQRDTREEMAELTQEHGLSYERFQQIAQAAQIGQMDAFSSEEVEAFNEVAPKVTEMQRNMQGTMQLIIQEHEMDMDDYRSVLDEFRQDEKLREYVSHLARERAREKILEERRRQAEKELEEKKQQEQNEQNQ